ncbi:hypothetical protein ARMGADRAFT_1039804 [Armillaria gallica]|uniref:Uncharacterized protein n=1 Tax=Armillaria gallica TaxID=47427 RepID=A0A2H3CCF3_ARMGA|nr:hypothetical protein ARMGADRAFT_1039804 [Armillaria gallica]
MTYEASPAVIGQNPDAPLNDEAAVKRKLARQPLITRRYEPDSLMKTALNAPITVPMGELMACNPELRKQIIKELQYRNIKMVENSEGTKSHYLDLLDDEPARVNLVRMQPIRAEPMIRSKLVIIKVELGVGDKKLLADAIIDSGSEINIVSQNIAHELNKIYPVTPLEQIRCSDANGNQGTLHGQFNNVHLRQANIVTNAALFIGNLSMDERLEGTYLVYRNPSRPKDYTELLVVDEKWENGRQEAANSYFTSTKDIEFEGAWKINEGEEIIELGPPVTYWTFLAMANVQNGVLIKKPDSEVPCLENALGNKTHLDLVIQNLESGCHADKCEEWEQETRKNTSSTRQYQIRRIEHRILVLKSLMGHMKCTETEENMPLLRGECLEYPKHVLPMWSIWGTESDTEDIKTRLCSAAEIYHSLRETTQILVALKRKQRRVLKSSRRCAKEPVNHRILAPRQTQSQTTMSFPIFQQSTDREIRLWLRSVTDSNNPSPVIPPNHAPRPLPLSKSSAYFPITELACQTHLVQLQNALFHPDVTSQDSFHAILLTANNAVRLETDHYLEMKLQFMPDYLDANLTVRHPRLPAHQTHPVTRRKRTFDDDGATKIVNPTVGSTRPSSVCSVIEDVGVIENEDMQGRIARTFVCRLSSGANKPIPSTGFRATGFQAEPSYVPIHILLPPMFVVMTAKLIELKCEDCLEAFMLPRDYSLRMRLDEGRLSRIIRDLARPSAMRYDYTIRTLLRIANDKGCALMLHHSLFLRIIHDVIFPCQTSNTECSQISMYDIPEFLAPLFILEDITQGILEESPASADSPPPLIFFDSSDEEEDIATVIRPTQKLITYPTPQEEETEMKATIEQPLQTPEKTNGNTALTLLSSSHAAALLPSMFTSITTLRSTQPSDVLLASHGNPIVLCRSSTLSAVSEESDTKSSMELDIPEWPFTNYQVYLDDWGAEIYQKTDDEEWGKEETEPTNKVKSPIAQPMLQLEVCLASDNSLYSPDTPPSTETFRYSRICPEAPLVASPTSMSDIDEPTALFTDPALYPYSSDDSEAYTPMSLDELKRANMQVTFFKEGPVDVGANTRLRLDEKPSQPEYYVCRTTEESEAGKNSALTYVMQCHGDIWHQSLDVIPLENGPLTPLPYDHFTPSFYFQVVHHYKGRHDNSPLLAEFNRLLPMMHEKYMPITGSDEYRIAKMGTKVYELLQDLDIKVEDWRHGPENCTQQDLEGIRTRIFTAANKQNSRKRSGEWGGHFYE